MPSSSAACSTVTVIDRAGDPLLWFSVVAPEVLSLVVMAEILGCGSRMVGEFDHRDDGWSRNVSQVRLAE
jgi:hypothetical protein